MGKKPRSINWYLEDDGFVPARDFLGSLDKRTRAYFMWSLDQLSKSDAADQSEAEYLEEQLWELREELGQGTCRLIFSHCSKQYIILLHGFHQQDNGEALPGEVEIASRRLSNCKQRKQQKNEESR